MQTLPEFNQRFVLKSRPKDLPGPEHFEIEDLAHPQLGHGQVRVRVLMVALSPWQGQRLKDFKNYAKPFEIGEMIDCDVLGEVVEIGADIDDAYGIGTRVTGRLGWQKFATASPSELLPATGDFGGRLWLTALSSPGLTAYCALDMFAQPMPGQTLVVTSAAGSVGAYAVQLGKLAGMRVVGIAGGEEKCAHVVKQLGADHCVDYRDKAFERELGFALPNGCDLFFDTVGGQVADSVFDNLAKYARVLVVGRTVSNNSDRPDLDYINMRQLWAREASIQCFSRYSYPREWAASRERMMALCKQGLVKSIDNVVDGFEQSPRALHDMLAGKYTGKVLVRYADPATNQGSIEL
ncbi:MAG: NADP-dependent oxidoreductase [Pseudomonadota bacterium]